jgi:exosortase A
MTNNDNSRWPQALAALTVVVAALLWLYRDTAVGMVGIWLRSETFTHAFVVPPISLWLIWRRRALLAQLTPRPTPWLLLPMALVALAWLLGSLAAVNVVTQFALVALLVLCVPALLGRAVARAIAFPLLFLFFCVPFGEFMIPTFMDWTADFTVWALKLSGIPVHREGLQFAIPSGTWSVEAACSGIRYLMASVMVGVLFAYLNFRSTWRRVVFVGVSILVPILANWVRAYLIVLIGHLSGNELATGADHLVYGWLFFGIVILLMLAVGGFWAQPELPMPSLGAGAQAGAAPVGTGRATVGAAVAALAVLALPHGWLGRVQDVPMPVPQLQAVLAPAPGWTQASQPMPDWQNAFVNPSAQLQRSFAQGERTVGLQLAYFATETADSKLVSSNNQLVAPKGAWVQVQRGQLAVTTLGELRTWRTAELKRSGPDDIAKARLVVWYGYWINGSFTASDARAKALLAFNRLMGRGGDGVVVMLYTPKTSPEQDQAALEGFLRDHLGALAAGLQRARGGAGG